MCRSVGLGYRLRAWDKVFGVRGADVVSEGSGSGGSGRQFRLAGQQFHSVGTNFTYRLDSRVRERNAGSARTERQEVSHSSGELTTHVGAK